MTSRPMLDSSGARFRLAARVCSPPAQAAAAAPGRTAVVQAPTNARSRTPSSAATPFTLEEYHVALHLLVLSVLRFIFTSLSILGFVVFAVVAFKGASGLLLIILGILGVVDFLGIFGVVVVRRLFLRIIFWFVLLGDLVPLRTPHLER